MASHLSSALRQSRTCMRQHTHRSFLSSNLLTQCRLASTATAEAAPTTKTTKSRAPRTTRTKAAKANENADALKAAENPQATDSLPPGVTKERRRVTRHPLPAKSPTTRRKEEEGDREVEESVPGSKLHLPPHSKWRKVFRITKEVGKRVSLRNPATCKLLAETWVPEGSRDRIVIEASPGPGQLTRALMNLPRERIRKLIVLEPVSQYLEYLKPLEEVDERVKVVPLHGQSWATYTEMRQSGLLDDVKTVDWDKGVHPQLTFIMTMAPYVDGEQLIAQLLRTIPDRQWLQQYGRVPMHFILTSRMWERIRAPPGSQARCKVSVMAEGAAKMHESVPYDCLQPYADHFHPERHNTHELKFGGLDLRRLGIPQTSATFIPLAHPKIERGDLDIWDYCARKLFVQKATPLEKCITALGPGANNLLPKLSDPEHPENKMDLNKVPRDFTINDWAKVVRVFKNWPFRPDDLGIDTLFALTQHNR